MGIFSVRPGSWSFYSRTDSRWNCHGRVEWLLVSAGLPKEAEEKLKELEAKYGNPPEDLHFSCMKD